MTSKRRRWLYVSLFLGAAAAGSIYYVSRPVRFVVAAGAYRTLAFNVGEAFPVEVNLETGIFTISHGDTVLGTCQSDQIAGWWKSRYAGQDVCYFASQSRFPGFNEMDVAVDCSEEEAGYALLKNPLPGSGVRPSVPLSYFEITPGADSCATYAFCESEARNGLGRFVQAWNKSGLTKPPAFADVTCSPGLDKAIYAARERVVGNCRGGIPGDAGDMSLSMQDNTIRSQCAESCKGAKIFDSPKGHCEWSASGGDDAEEIKAPGKRH